MKDTTYAFFRKAFAKLITFARSFLEKYFIFLYRIFFIKY
jgi:hypothetical protein